MVRYGAVRFYSQSMPERSLNKGEDRAHIPGPAQGCKKRKIKDKSLICSSGTEIRKKTNVKIQTIVLFFLRNFGSLDPSHIIKG